MLPCAIQQSLQIQQAVQVKRKQDAVSVASILRVTLKFATCALEPSKPNMFVSCVFGSRLTQLSVVKLSVNSGTLLVARLQHVGAMERTVMGQQRMAAVRLGRFWQSVV